MKWSGKEGEGADRSGKIELLISRCGNECETMEGVGESGKELEGSEERHLSLKSRKE